jgi:deoxyadenosine/deoxycytidine kinase
LFVLLNRAQKQQQQLVSSSFLPEADRTVVEDWGIHNCGVAKVEQKECLQIGLDLAQNQQHSSL